MSRVEFSNVKVSLDAMLPQNKGMFEREVARACGLGSESMRSLRLLRRSVDARKKSDVHFVVSVVADMPDVALASDLDKLKRRVRKGVSLKLYEPPHPLEMPDCTDASTRDGFKRPVVVGAGPAGLFAALCLARSGLRPLVIERGKPAHDRQRDVDAFNNGGALNPNSNIQFGEGGAGTFSDGKLNTGTKSPHIRHVLEEFVKAGAPDQILVDAKPHIGTDLLPDIVSNIRKAIEAAGGEFRFQTQLTGIELEDVKNESMDSERPAIRAVVLRDLATSETERLGTDTLVLAIGHSARDTYAMLHDLGIPMERKPFAVGVRVEHLQSAIDRSQYGDAASHPALGAADYKLAVHNDDDRGVYTFCMCPGGTVVAASSEPKALCVNGMSTNARNGRNANSALLVEVLPDDLPGDDVLAGVAFQRELERGAYELGMSKGAIPYTCPAQTVGDFQNKTSGNSSKTIIPTYPRGVHWVDLHDMFPPFVAEAMTEALPKLDRKLNGFADPDAVMSAVEARSSSPVRIIRERQDFQSIGARGLYPIGEGAGYAGGIMSAAVDGIRVAEAIAATIAGWPEASTHQVEATAAAAVPATAPDSCGSR